MTFQELDTLFWAQLHRDTTIGDSQRVQFLNLAQERIRKDAPDLLGVKRNSVVLAAGTHKYPLPADLYQLRTVYWGKWHPLVHLEPEEVEAFLASQVTRDGRPYAFWIEEWDTDNSNWTIEFDRSQTDDEHDVEFSYWWKSPPLTVGQVTPVLLAELGFSDLLLQCGLMIARERNDPEGFNFARMRYREELALAQNRGPAAPRRKSRLQESGTTYPFSRLPPDYPPVL